MSRSARDVVSAVLEHEILEETWPEKFSHGIADAILAALREAGYKLAGPDEVVVPREPTGDETGYPNMKRAGAAKMWDIWKADPGLVGLAQVAEIYRAMLSAAPSARPEGEGE